MKKKATISRREIASAAGVSPSTVSRALAGSPLIPEAT
ncbi:MAG: LacI family DNA-binding transcriptional regulator, partial [Spirochaetota bacterium]